MGDAPAPDAVEGLRVPGPKQNARENARYTMPERMSDRMSDNIYIYTPYTYIYILPNRMSETICQNSVSSWGSLKVK